MLGGYSASFLDARGKLVARSYDILGGAEFFLLLHWIVRSSLLNVSAGLCRLVFNICIPEA